jgi:bifunctional NMN adenylyltransferase/nudix hydrolase
MTASYDIDFAVFIGRMRPPHLAHEFIINEALKRAKCLIVLVGSANRARSYMNSAFSFPEVSAILEMLYKHQISTKRIIIKPLPDYIYDEAGWIANTKLVVNNAITEHLVTEGKAHHDPSDYKIALAGFGKDSSSYYLKRFPEWDSIQVGKQFALLSACHIREAFFQRVPQTSAFGLSPKVIEYLHSFMHRDEFVYVVREREAIEKNIKDYGLGPFNAGDIILTHADKVLTITRNGGVGYGLEAFPGGMHNLGETLNACALREFDEEASAFRLNPGFKEVMLSHFAGYRHFDAPNRDPRGQYISHTYHYALPDDFPIHEIKFEARDDAKAIKWNPIAKWGHETAFLDHYGMLRTFLPHIHA